jgi:hypothetical protein
MSLKPSPIQPIPEETVRVAQRDELGPIFRDEDFTDLLNPNVLLLILT